MRRIKPSCCIGLCLSLAFVLGNHGEVVFRSAGTGDVDLYLRKGGTATRSQYTLKSDGPTSNETARTMMRAGDEISFLLYAYKASTASLVVDEPDPAKTKTIELVPTTSLASYASRSGSIVVEIGGEMVFWSKGDGNVDIYVRRGAQASKSSYTAKSTLSTSYDEVRIQANAGDVLYYYFRAEKTSTASLMVTVPTQFNYDPVLSLAKLTEEAGFTAFSTPGGGLSTSGRSLKFLADVRTPSAPTMNFINGNYKVNGTVPDYAKYHYYFAKRRYNLGDDVGTFNNSTYFTNQKRFFAGSVQTYQLGEAATRVYAIQFYPDDVIAEETLLTGIKLVKAAISIPGAKVVFVATGPQQTFARIEQQAADLGVEIMTIDEVLGNIKYVALNNGQAWGYLRIFPTDTNVLRPTDIPVFNDLPLDLSVVAGTITKAYQDVNSHVNLKSKERGTPNMVLRDAGTEHALLQQFADQPVHLVVASEGFTIEATTPEIVQQKLAEKLNKPWIPLPVVDSSSYLSFDEMGKAPLSACFNYSKSYGGKSTGLGFLAGSLGRTTTSGSVSAQYGIDLSPFGIGIPTKYYRDFLGAPENAALKTKIDELIAAEKGGNLSPVERNAMVASVQALFYKAYVPGTIVADVAERIRTVLPGVTNLKFRSSATSEDVPNFNGAGLYDSFSIEPAKVDNPDFSCRIETETDGVVTKLKVKPKTIQCGIKAVYASLWNSRAIVERTFGRLDHETASMGITVNPSYGDEQANMVLVTRVIGTDTIYGYTLSVQKGENLVTNPIPGTITEFDVISFSDASRPPRITTTRYAKPTVADPVMTTTILTERQMLDIVDIARKIEISYCKAKPSYYSGDCNKVWLDLNKPLALDMEIKILPSGNIQFKQVREFHGR